MSKLNNCRLVLNQGSNTDPSQPNQDDGLLLVPEKTALKRPSMYQVVMLNDDFTPMHFVVEVLVRFFAMNEEKATQVMMAVHKKRATFDPTRPFLPWLAAIARYRWVDHLRKVYRNAEDALEDFDAPEDSDEEAVLAHMSLERLFVQIPEKQSEVIAMVKIEGLSIKEAADKSGQTESAVKVNIHRGLKKMSALIEKAE